MTSARTTLGVTLTELLVAVAVMAIVLSAVLPLLSGTRHIRDTAAANSEIIQNARVLMSHLSSNLARATRIIAVGDSDEPLGYIQFMDGDANTPRYELAAAGGYIRYGLPGNLSDLAGPANLLQFTCYDVNDFATPITEVNEIRFIRVRVDFANPNPMARNMTFSTSIFLRANGGHPMDPDSIAKAASCEYDPVKSQSPALARIDAGHFLCTYAGDGDKGRAVVLTVNTTPWQITNGAPFIYDTQQGKTPALSPIDSAHYLCAYSGKDDDGYAVVLTVNPATWQISQYAPFEYDSEKCKTPSLAAIDSTHYLCAYSGKDNDGYAVVLTVNPNTWQITKQTPFEYAVDEGQTPVLAKIDSTHYLCAYSGKNDDGYAVVLAVNPTTWQVSEYAPFEHDTANCEDPSLTRIDATHFLCDYSGAADDGFSVVLAVNPTTWQIAKAIPFEYDSNKGKMPALARIDAARYLCAYRGKDNDGWAVILNVDSSTWSISGYASYEFDTKKGMEPALAQVDKWHYLCAHKGDKDDGWAVILELTGKPLP